MLRKSFNCKLCFITVSGFQFFYFNLWLTAGVNMTLAHVARKFYYCKIRMPTKLTLLRLQCYYKLNTCCYFEQIIMS